MTRHTWTATFASVALLLASACSGVDKNENNNTPTEYGSLSGEVSITLSCDASDVDADCAGNLYLVVMLENPITNPYQAPEAVELLSGVDLAAGPVSYTIDNLPVGDWYISGFLDDDSNATPAAPAPTTGDPIGYPAPQVTIHANQTTTEDIALTVEAP